MGGIVKDKCKMRKAKCKIKNKKVPGERLWKRKIKIAVILEDNKREG